MRLLRLAVETQRWELAAHVLILGAIKAKQRRYGRYSVRQQKKQGKAKGR
jgi:hypothetical protein